MRLSFPIVMEALSHSPLQVGNLAAREDAKRDSRFADLSGRILRLVMEGLPFNSESDKITREVMCPAGGGVLAKTVAKADHERE